MKTKQKVSHPKAEEEFMTAITNAITKYQSLLLSREIRKGLRTKNKNYALRA